MQLIMLQQEFIGKVNVIQAHLITKTLCRASCNCSNFKSKMCFLAYFPNPANNVINVTLNDKISGKVVLNIYDAQGSLVQTKSTYKNSPQMQQTFNVKSLSPGVYNLANCY